MNVQTKLLAMKVAAAKIRSQGFDSAYMEEWGRAFEVHADSVTIPLMSEATREVFERWLQRPLVVTRSFGDALRHAGVLSGYEVERPSDTDLYR